MFIDIIGWIMIIGALYLVFVTFKSKKGSVGYKVFIRIIAIGIAIMLIILGAFATGHTKRVAAAHKAAVSSSLAESRKISSTEASESRAADSSSKKVKSSSSYKAFKKSVNELATNSGATAKVSDSEVQIIVNDDTASENASSKKSLASGYITRITKIANMCELSSVPFVIIQTQSGDNIARSTVTGGIKVYD